MIHDEIIPHLKGKLGVITEIFRYSDGIIRSAKLTVGKGTTNRTASKLYPLEVKSSVIEQGNKLCQDSLPSRPRLDASTRCLELLKDM